MARNHSPQPPFRPQRIIRFPRANDSRTDFFIVYHREFGEFDRDYAGNYDEDLNTSLIFVSLLPFVVLDTGPERAQAGQLCVHRRCSIKS